MRLDVYKGRAEGVTEELDVDCVQCSPRNKDRSQDDRDTLLHEPLQSTLKTAVGAQPLPRRWRMTTCQCRGVTCRLALAEAVVSSAGGLRRCLLEKRQQPGKVWNFKIGLRHIGVT